MSYKGRASFDKLEHARTPILFVHACDDPLSPAQGVGDLISTIDNPLVCAVILPSGGHVGFAAYCKEYYFSLIANFFDPVVGAAARCFGGTKTAPPREPGADCSPQAASFADLWSNVRPLHWLFDLGRR